MERGCLISQLELKLTRSAGASAVEYLDLRVDGLPIRERLSFEKYDELISSPDEFPFARLSKMEAQRVQSFSLSQSPEPYSSFVRRACQGEPSRIGYGRVVAQWETIQEMLLRGIPGRTRRCKLFACLNCNCHAISAMIEAVDGCFIWHSFLSEYAWQSASVELGGGPFVFDAESYIEALEGAVKTDP